MVALFPLFPFSLPDCCDQTMESRGQTPGSLASGSRRREPWRLALESEKDSCLLGETDFVEAFTPSFDPKAQHINRGAGLAPKTQQLIPWIS